jgi:hypothetical protein
VIPRIPERDVAQARLLGLRETDIAGSWNRYVKWTVERFGEAALLGGEPWSKWAREDAVNIAKNREAQDESKDRKRREDAAYAAEAVGFAGACEALVRRLGRSSPGALPMTQHEVGIATWWASLERKPTGVNAVMLFGELAARGGCLCDSCSSVSRRRRRGRPAPEPVTLEPAPDDETYALRRQQSIEDLRTEFPSEFTDGLGLEAAP